MASEKRTWRQRRRQLRAWLEHPGTLTVEQRLRELGYERDAAGRWRKMKR